MCICMRMIVYVYVYTLIYDYCVIHIVLDLDHTDLCNSEGSPNIQLAQDVLKAIAALKEGQAEVSVGAVNGPKMTVVSGLSALSVGGSYGYQWNDMG